MKRFIILLPCILLFLVSCQDKESLAELEKVKSQTELEEQNMALIESYINVWNTKDLQLLDELLDPQYKFYLPSNAKEPFLIDQLKGWIGMLYETYSDIHYDIQEIHATGDKVSLRWTCKATHSSDNLGIPATGKVILGSAVEIFTIKEGKIVEERAETDALGWNQQLGL